MSDGLTSYGFRWGPIEVERSCVYRDRLWSMRVRTDHHELQIGVSKAGRSVRVWLDGEEMRTSK